MPMTPEERRERDRRRKAAQRANKRNSAGPDATVTFISSAPDVPAEGGTQGGTRGGTSVVPPSKMPAPPAGIPESTLAAVDAQLEGLDIPASALLLATQARMFAAALDDVTRVPQWGSLSESLRRVMESLEKAAQSGTSDPLTGQRVAFWRGEAYESGDPSEGKTKRA